MNKYYLVENFQRKKMYRSIAVSALGFLIFGVFVLISNEPVPSIVPILIIALFLGFSFSSYLEAKKEKRSGVGHYIEINDQYLIAYFNNKSQQFKISEIKEIKRMPKLFFFEDIVMKFKSGDRINLSDYQNKNDLVKKLESLMGSI